MNALLELQNWYQSNCDEEWEHYYGVQIETLDNPGWSLKIDLIGTNLEGRPFPEINHQNTDDDWYFCRVINNQFEGAGDAQKLERLIQTFLTWAKSQNDDWLKPPPPLTEQEIRGQEDQQFYESIKEEILTEKCRRENCGKHRIRNSVLCRDHNFEMIRKYPYQTKTT